MTIRKLTAKQARFCDEYLTDCNGTQAAIRAGYAATRAAETAHDLLRHVGVAARLVALQNERSARTRITAENVLEALWREANAGDLAQPSGARVSALEKVGKHLGLFVDRLEVAGAGGRPLVVNLLPETREGFEKL